MGVDGLPPYRLIGRMPEIKSSPEGHVAIITWPFSSHPSALFNLAVKLASAAPAVQFSFFSTVWLNKHVLSKQETDIPTNIKAYDVDDGAPEGFVIGKDESEDVGFFVNATPENFDRGIDASVRETGRRITCLVTDTLLSFEVGKMAEEMKVPWISFWVPAPYTLSAHVHMDLIQELYTEAGGPPQGHQTLEIIPGLSAMRFEDLPRQVLPGYRAEPDWEIFSSMAVKLPEASAVVLNSYEELNPALVTADLKSMFQKLLYVGFSTLPVPLPPPISGDQDNTRCLSWLDGQNPASVAYVSFGTVAELPREEWVALAEALEASRVPFLWSLKDMFKNQLPDGFLERTSMQGKVVPWAPQSQVLAHPSVGVHVTHGGYNSVNESILAGVPMICRTVWADNHMNGRMVEKVWGIGVTINGRVITKSEMIKSLEVVLQDEKGKRMRDAIVGLKEVVLKAAGTNNTATRDFGALVQIVISKE